VYVARTLLLPIVLAILGSLVLRPVVAGTRRLGIPSALGAALVVGALIGAGGYAVVTLATPAAAWIERAPQSARTIQHKLRFVREPIERMSDVTREVEEAAQLDDDDESQTVVLRPPPLSEVIVSHAQSLVAGLLITLILLYFLLAAPDRLLSKLVSLAPRFGDKKLMVAAMREVQVEVSRYLLTISAINAALGVAVGLAMFALGMPNPALWGVLAAAANFVPYAGAAAMALVIAAVGVLSYDQPLQMLTPALVFVTLTSIEAYLVTPIVLGRRLTMRRVAVFVAVVAGSWLWGIPGALIAVPVLAAMKIVTKHVPSLEPVSQLLD
jgi:predicted PurR-regulated permease PerM